MNKEEILSLLDQDSIRIVTDFQAIQYAEVSGSSVYFRFIPNSGGQGPYERFSRSDEKLDQRLNSIIRIEKKYNDRYYPIWTKDDGIIDINEKFVRLNGKFYTIAFLEDLLRKNSIT